MERIGRFFITTMATLLVASTSGKWSEGLFGGIAGHQGNIHQVVASNLFQPLHQYSAESLLLPIIANILGMVDRVQYQYFSFAVTIFAICGICWILAGNFRSKLDALIGGCMLGAFPAVGYLFRGLGYPEPVTFLLLTMAMKSKNSHAFILIVLAALNHLSTIILATPVMVLIRAFYLGNRNIPLGLGIILDRTLIKQFMIFLSAILIGKFLIFCWFYVFEYTAQSRVSTMFDIGAEHLIAWQAERLSDFFFVLGWPWLVFILIFLGFLNANTNMNTAILIVCSGVFFAYIGHMITEDRPRIFGAIFFPVVIFAIGQLKISFNTLFVTGAVSKNTGSSNL